MKDIYHVTRKNVKHVSTIYYIASMCTKQYTKINYNVKIEKMKLEEEEERCQWKCISAKEKEKRRKMSMEMWGPVEPCVQTAL